MNPSTSSGPAAPTTIARATISIRVNDDVRTIAATTTLADLVRDLGLAERKGVAIAVNNSVARCATWAMHLLAEGDRVLVIRATQGG